MTSAKIGTFITNFFCVSAFCLSVHALPGDLDTTFDGDGKATVAIGHLDYAKDVAIQSDGKIVVAGYTEDNSSPSNSDISMARFNADGSLDTTFGSSGKVYLSGESGTQAAYSVIVLSDGKIMLFGSDNHQLAVLRFNANGSVDNTFGINGRVVHTIGLESAAYDAVMQPDGKFVLAGYVQFTGESWRFTVFRLNPNGSLDTSFSSIGYTPVLFGGTRAYSVALQTDGKIVAGGRDTGSDNFGYMGRFSSDGILEGGVSALVQTNVQINSIAVQSDGKIVGGGYIRTVGSGITQTSIVRFNADRSLDIHFGNSGIYTIDWGPNGSTLNRGHSLLIQSSGRIVIGGRARFPFDFALARLNSNGFLDVGFGNGGKVITDFGVESDEIYGIAQQADGKILAVGNAAVGTTYDFGVVRYDGSDSNTAQTRAQFDFDGDGRADVSVVRPSTATWYIFNSRDSSVTIRTFGNPGDVPIPADYDADARTDFGVYQPTGSSWWWNSSVTGFTQTHTNHVQGDFPRNGDFTGDGRADIVIYQASTGMWNRRDITSTSAANVAFGAAGDKPVLGDFDGDTKVDPAIYRPSTGEWWYAASSAGGAHRAARWGISTDIPAPADFDGDHKTDFAVYRPSEGVWYIYNSATNSPTILNFGLSEDKPVAADYDGDGKADIAVFRPSTGIWYLMQSTAGFSALQWGIATDIPIPNAFVP